MIRNKTYDYIVRLGVKFKKLAHFEYWPTLLIYIPLVPKLVSLFVRSGSLYAFRDTNPGFRFKSIIRESKIDILNSIPAKWLPKTLFLNQADRAEWKGQILEFQNFPIICKPETGERGRGVSLLRDEIALDAYLSKFEGNLIVQEYIHYPIELGIFYIRIPGEKKGFISSIVRKEPMEVIGDGISTLRVLMENNFRYLIQLLAENKDRELALDMVLPKGKRVVLDPIANHARGTRFVDCYEYLHPEMEEVIGSISDDIKGFYYGRFDLKIESLDSFKEGVGIKIIELNGIWSEPTHIYDSRNSILDNYKTIADHFNYAYLIAKLNRERNIEA